MATIYQRPNGTYYANYMLEGRQVRHSLRTYDQQEALEKLAAITRRSDVAAMPADAPSHTERPWGAQVAEGVTHGGWLLAMHARAKDRARSRRIPFYLTIDHVRTIAMRSQGRCELTCLPFSWERIEGSMFPPMAPTLDRIVPRQGYSSGNCRLVTHAVNLALCDWGEAVFSKIAHAYVEVSRD